MNVEVDKMQDALAKIQVVGDRALSAGVFKAMADVLTFRQAVEDLGAGFNQLFRIAQDQAVTISTLERAAALKLKDNG